MREEVALLTRGLFISLIRCLRKCIQIHNLWSSFYRFLHYLVIKYGAKMVQKQRFQTLQFSTVSLKCFSNKNLKNANPYLMFI